MNYIKTPISFFRSPLAVKQLFVNLLLAPTILTLTNTPTSSAMNLFENVSLSTIEIIRNNGYDVEVHNVITADGYILELHRIPRSKSGQEPTRNHPVFIHHGILGTSADWVLAGAEMSLPMQLADAGYDVWLANCRGNTYSRKHISMTFKQKAFWNFSLHEVGYYDLPASIDYILSISKTSQLHYIGYSMGSCVFFIMGSERPEYQPKIRSQISLAPVAFLSNTRSSLRFIAPYAKTMNIVFQRIWKGMLMPQSGMQRFLASTICREKITQKMICEKCIIFSVCGSDPYQFDTKLIPLIMGHFPAGTSSNLAAHFAQFILKDTFGQYDYGRALNLRYYNSTEPPTYDLKSIRVPITLIYGENDILADTTDVLKLKAQLPMVVDAFPAKSPYFNHVDFLWSSRVVEQINDPVKEILQKTDDLGWTYTGPAANSSAVAVDAIVPAINRPPIQTLQLNPLSGVVNPAPSLEFFAANLDAIIASTMPRPVDERDAAVFEREREQQRLLFGGVIKFAQAAEKKYGQLREEITNEITGWADDVATGAESRVKQTAVLVNGKIVLAGNSVAGAVGKAEHFVADGVGKAEQTVAVGIGKAHNYVNYGLNKADRAVNNALNATVGRVSRVFWFWK
ncbi:PREDICTED: lipase 3-like isoform X1 [Diuraphis noxia]|uniref:lipase 3-like isoform X1 n=2 Tax=Diuraphis noxia TaxID=143948 RepID=UPI000763880C|nr:PREDICTED: lipase 3-like isoform X1 [Diuraphis noxia]